MTTGLTDSSGVEEESAMPGDTDFDPDATGVIPRVTEREEPDGEQASEEDTAPRRRGKKARKEAKAAAIKARQDDSEAEPDAGRASESAPEPVSVSASLPEPESTPMPEPESESVPEPESESESESDEDDHSATVAIRLPLIAAAKDAAVAEDDAETTTVVPRVVLPVTSAADAVVVDKADVSAVAADVAADADVSDADASGADVDESTVERRLPATLKIGSPPEAPQAPQAPVETPEAPPAVPKALSEAPAVPLESPGAPGDGEAAGATVRVPRASPVPAPVEAGAGGMRARAAALLASAPGWLPVVLTIEGLVMYVLALRVSPGPLRGVDPDDIDGLGLISALPLAAFGALLLMLVSFFVTVAQRTDRKFLLLFQIAVITFALHGASALVSDAPRFPTAYVHAGFVDYIARTGETAIFIDARMAWPGFFALFAFVTKAAGITDLTSILMWTPLLSNLLYLLPFVLILRQVVATTRARWFAALLFVLVQWIGQDYFSPQGFTFAIYLAFVAILLRWFGRVERRTKPMPAKGGIRRLFARLDTLDPGELANTGTFRADKLVMLLMLITLFFAATASHQITPFMMLGVLTAFLLFKRTSLTWALPFFFGLVVLAWISYQTVGFWAGHIDQLFGGLGRILDNLQRNTGDRIAGSDPEHAMVLQFRLGICAAVLALAAVGLFRRMRRGVFDRAALILLCVPVLALGLQSYGGEIGLRIYMFMLPGACLLAAYAFFPNLPADSADASDETVPVRRRNARLVRFNPDLTKKISLVLAACMAVVFAGSFLVARYGNEKFERVTPGEVAAMHYIYDHDKPSARVLYLVPKEGPEITQILPWGEQSTERIFYEQALVHKDPTDIGSAVARLRASERNTFLIVTTGQAGYLELNEEFPAGWGKRFRAAMDASPDVKRVFSNADAAVYTWKNFARGTQIPDPPSGRGFGDPTSPWTPVGLGAMTLTWLALFAYEVIRLQGPGRAPRARRRLLWVAIPAFALSIAVIVERFIALGMP